MSLSLFSLIHMRRYCIKLRHALEQSIFEISIFHILYKISNSPARFRLPIPLTASLLNQTPRKLPR